MHGNRSRDTHCIVKRIDTEAPPQPHKYSNTSVVFEYKRSTDVEGGKV